MSLFSLKWREPPSCQAEVVGSNPTRSTFFYSIENYGIKLSSFSVIVGQNPPAIIEYSALRIW
jgi:hypothetical protein